MRLRFWHPPIITAFTTVSVLLLLVSSPSARADRYQLTTIEYTQQETFYGIDGAGDFTVNRSNTLSGFGRTCGTVTNAPSCYETFYAGGGAPVFSTDPPTLSWDDGSACHPAAGPAFSFVAGVCNSGHSLLSGFYTQPDQSLLRGIWAGPHPDPIKDLLSNGLLAGGLMNASGDAVFIDTFNDTLVFADDLSTNVTPEPSSLLLLGTGGLALLASIRWRLLPTR